MSCQPDGSVPDDITLTDIGAADLTLGGGWFAVEAVDADGSRSYWLLDPAVVDENEHERHPLPAHELDGPLPDDVAARVRRVTS